jgi:hypothetical protein
VFISKIAKKKGKRYARASKKSPRARATTTRAAPRFEQLTLDEALRHVPKVNRRSISPRTIVVVAGGAKSSSSAKPKRKRSAKKKSAARHTKNRAVRRAARKGGNMAKRRSGKKRRKGSRGRRRIRCITYMRKGKHVARRVNPGIPAPLGAALAVAVGACGGVGLSYLADKSGFGSPNQRAVALFLSGLVIAAAGHKIAPGPSAAIGAGVGGIGLLRGVQTMLYATPQAPMSGLGTGSASMEDIAGAFAQLGAGGSIFDRIGAVVSDDVGLVVGD